MKFGLNFKTGNNWYLTSWKTVEDPFMGDFTYKLDICGLPQLLLRKGGESGDVQYRSRPWDRVGFGGGFMRKNSVFNSIFVFDAEEVYYPFENNDKSSITRFVVNQSGLVVVVMAVAATTVVAVIVVKYCNRRQGFRKSLPLFLIKIDGKEIDCFRVVPPSLLRFPAHGGGGYGGGGSYRGCCNRRRGREREHYLVSEIWIEPPCPPFSILRDPSY
uniref:Uncharacterized protein n=1 Tax=Nelumbo nucifera TaxID=4432 RepID=A0A822XXB0_NELNU|nr:TPA_asm: hypothetical protein HUJ06_027722 [Nelumbo nucifera]